MYPETGESAARWMERELRLPYTKTVPIGVGATRDFLNEVSQITGLDPVVDDSRLRLPWYSASVDSNYLTGKRVFIFGDGTHAMAAARIARDEMGFEVVGLGCYNREMARPLRALAKDFGLSALITDDYLEVEKHIAEAAPEMILGTQMERHIGKRLGIPCAVISAPVHVQDFPARYSPKWDLKGQMSSLTHGFIRWSWVLRNIFYTCSVMISNLMTPQGQATTVVMHLHPAQKRKPLRNNLSRSKALI